MFTSTVGSKCQDWDTYITIILTLQRIASNKSFDCCKCEIENVRNIRKRVEYSGNWDIFGTLPLVKTKLSFWTMAMIGKKIEFKTIFNQATIVGSARSCESCGSQVEF